MQANVPWGAPERICAGKLAPELPGGHLRRQTDRFACTDALRGAPGQVCLHRCAHRALPGFQPQPSHTLPKGSSLPAQMRSGALLGRFVLYKFACADASFRLSARFSVAPGDANCHPFRPSPSPRANRARRARSIALCSERRAQPLSWMDLPATLDLCRQTCSQFPPHPHHRVCLFSFPCLSLFVFPSPWEQVCLRKRAFDRLLP